MLWQPATTVCTGRNSTTCSSTFVYIHTSRSCTEARAVQQDSYACTASASSGSSPLASVACAHAQSREPAISLACSGYTALAQVAGLPGYPCRKLFAQLQRHGCNAVRAPQRSKDRRRCTCVRCWAGLAAAVPRLRGGCATLRTSADGGSLEAARHLRSPSLGSALSKRSSDADASPICTSSRRTAPCARCRPPPCRVPRVRLCLTPTLSTTSLKFVDTSIHDVCSTAPVHFSRSAPKSSLSVYDVRPATPQDLEALNIGARWRGASAARASCARHRSSALCALRPLCASSAADSAAATSSRALAPSSSPHWLASGSSYASRLSASCPAPAPASQWFTFFCLAGFCPACSDWVRPSPCMLWPSPGEEGQREGRNRNSRRCMPHALPARALQARAAAACCSRPHGPAYHSAPGLPHAPAGAGRQAWTAGRHARHGGPLHVTAGAGPGAPAAAPGPGRTRPRR